MNGLKQRWFHILLALARSDLHGSAIAREVEEQSEGRTRMWPVALYGSLQELCDLGFISELTDPADRPSGASEKHRYYRITKSGRRALEKEARGLAQLASEALARSAAKGQRA